MKAQGETRICTLAAPTTIDEETNAAVAAYATFDDIGGNGIATELPRFELSDSFTAASLTITSFGSSTEAITYKIPILDGEGRTAWYQANSKYLVWNPTLHPQVDHQKQFLSGHSLELNVPGIDPYDQRSYVYYESHANFNIYASTSVSLWFYPTYVSSIASETWRTLFYRRIDASNSYAILIKAADSKMYVFINEAGTTTKLVSSSTVNMNAWNNIIFTYNPTTNALVLYLNDDSTSSTPADTYTTPYTTDAHMYIGGIPGLPDIRYTGFIDNFVFWTGKILTATEVDNMWNH